MTTTPIQKCALNLQQKAALSGKKMSTAQAIKECSRKFKKGPQNISKKGK